jgi:hypothetical protein
MGYRVGVEGMRRGRLPLVFKPSSQFETSLSPVAASSATEQNTWCFGYWSA